MTDCADTQQDWPLRPWILSALLGAAGLLIYFTTGDEGLDTRVGWKAALTAALVFGPLAFAFTLERDRWRAPLAFAAAVGAVMAGLAWRAVSSGDSYASPEFGFMAGVVATGLALPLFQAGFHRMRWRTDYRAIHGHVWSDAIGAAGSPAFVGASWLMLFLLAELFHLLKLDFLKDLTREAWFGWTWSGAAFGAALGVLRNEAAIIGTLRRVVMTVLSLLAVPLAAGLALFLGAMVVSGPEVLWEATRSATPVLLTCAAGAWLLANAILRDEDASMSGNHVLRWAGLVLVLSILPLTVFAAVSMGTRIAQHGLSPERLWGLVAIAVAVAYGLAWLVAVARGWRAGEWRERVRRGNLHLAVMICGVALFLALPILDFGAISARQQVARLESGAVSAEEFDYAALRWDFGDAGRRALSALARSANAEIARGAALALRDRRPTRNEPPKIDPQLVVVQTDDPAMRARVLAYFKSDLYRCATGCYAIDLGPAQGGRRFAVVGGYTAQAMILRGDGQFVPDYQRDREAQKILYRHGDRVGIGTVTRRVITVNGKPVGEPLDFDVEEGNGKLEGRPPPR